MIIWVIWIKYLIPIHPLSNIEVTKYFNCKPRFNSVYSRDHLPRTKYGVCAINLAVRESKGTQ